MNLSVYKDSHSWKELPWKKFQKHLFGLQIRVYEAVRRNDTKLVLSLQKLIVRSSSARYLAIRQVMELLQDNKMSRVDGVTYLNPTARFKLETKLREDWSKWNHSKSKNLKVLKKNGLSKTFEMPDIEDHVWQCLIRYSIEPAHEATFNIRNYGFRPGKSKHDAQQYLCKNLNWYEKGLSKTILELDMKQCFEQLDHKTLMKKVIAPAQVKQALFRGLKAGIRVNFPPEDSPQKKLLGPLLANILVNGIENVHKSIRYGNHMILILSPGENSTSILTNLDNFLHERRLSANKKTTKLTSIQNGFNFLDWTFIPQSKTGKVKSIPTKENFTIFRTKIKTILNSPNISIENKVRKLEPIVTKWRRYNQYCDMSGSKESLWGMIKRANKIFNSKSRNKYESKRLVRMAFPKLSYYSNDYSKDTPKKSF